MQSGWQRTAHPTKPTTRWSLQETPTKLLKLPRQIDCSPQQTQIMGSRNLDPAKLLQMGCEPLCVEQDELAREQVFHERHERNLGCIGHPMKHRFAKKRAADCDAVKATGEPIFFPSLD